MTTIRAIIKRRDNATDDDIDDMFAEVSCLREDGFGPEEIMEEVFGLEPDYVFDTEFWKALGV